MPLCLPCLLCRIVSKTWQQGCSYSNQTGRCFPCWPALRPLIYFGTPGCCRKTCRKCKQIKECCIHSDDTKTTNRLCHFNKMNIVPFAVSSSTSLIHPMVNIPINNQVIQMWFLAQLFVTARHSVCRILQTDKWIGMNYDGWWMIGVDCDLQSAVRIAIFVYVHIEKIAQTQHHANARLGQIISLTQLIMNLIKAAALITGMQSAAQPYRHSF